MTNVYLAGRMGKLVGKSFKFNTRTLRETLEAIEANTNKLKSYLLKSGKRKLAIFIDGKELDSSMGLQTNVKGKTVRIIPLLMGGFVVTGKIIAAALIKSATAVTLKKVVAFVVSTILFAAFSFGMSLLMAKLMAEDDPEQQNTTSFVFGPPENIASQGGPIPVGYGRMIVGSRTISIKTLDYDKGSSNLEFKDFLNSVAPQSLDNETEMSDFGIYST